MSFSHLQSICDDMLVAIQLKHTIIVSTLLALTLFSFAGFAQLPPPPPTPCSTAGECRGDSGGGRNVPICDSDCQDRRAEIEENNREYREWKVQHDEEERARKAHNKIIDKANKYSTKAWDLIKDDNHEDCAKAIPLYRQALALDNFAQWSQNIAYCYGKLGQPMNEVLEEQKISSDPNTDAEGRKNARWIMWSTLYRMGYECPDYSRNEYPDFDASLKGCVGIPSKVKEPTYVPLPQIDGKSWTPMNFLYSKGGTFSITTKDGHTYGPDDNARLVNMLDARVRTGKNTHIRVTLPDGHDFVMGPESDMVFDSFVYNPNMSTTEAVIQNLKGIVRFVTSVIVNHAPPQDMRIKLPVGSLGMRGTDVEIVHSRADAPDVGPEIWAFIAHSGDVAFIDPQGKTIQVPAGSQLLYDTDSKRTYTGAGTKGNVAILNATDSWDTSPN